MPGLPYYRDASLTLLLGDAATELGGLPDGCVDCVVTSPPYYGLRNYGHGGQIGSEATLDDYVARLVTVFAEVRRVLADDGTAWLNLGDSYPTKDLLGVPWRVAFALQAEGWCLRNAIVWYKPNAMPESVKDRFARRHEMVFLLVKTPRDYWFDLDAVREAPPDPKAKPRKNPIGGRKLLAITRANGWDRHRGLGSTHTSGRNPGDVWRIATQPLDEDHPAAFPPELARRCIRAGCKPDGTVLDPFSGAGTTALAARQLHRNAVGIDLVAEYHDIALRRILGPGWHERANLTRRDAAS